MIEERDSEEVRESGGCKPIPAKEILRLIEKGEDVKFENRVIEGDLDLERGDLPKIHFADSRVDSKKINFITSEISLVNCCLRGVFNIHNSIFYKPVNFNDTIFTNNLILEGSIFRDESKFVGMISRKDIKSRYAQFSKEADFRNSKFEGDVDFRDARFKIANFRDAQFKKRAWFDSTNFNEARFWRSRFEKYAGFGGSRFYGKCRFNHVRFNENADFNNAHFEDDFLFCEAKFDKRANFKSTNSARNATLNFERAKFNEDSDFTHSVFYGDVNFGNAIFIGYANFNETKFNKNLILNNSRIYDMSLGSSFGCESDIILEGANFDKLRCLIWDDIKDHLDDYRYDGAIYLALVNNFKNIERFDDADNCYYKFRLISQGQKHWYDPKKSWLYRFNWSKLYDHVAWRSCGYGIRPIFTLAWIFGSIFGFTVLYRILGGITKSSTPEITMTALNNSTLLFLSATSKTSPTFWECLYFSALSFIGGTPVGHSTVGAWKYAVMFESVLGYLFLALFVVVLARKLIR
ncbi:MAG TPA: pentapeptide repeat-containing protein [Methanothrix sp.]|nr:pentapeptide repeat-containing protein [Methanothrix sp.]